MKNKKLQMLVEGAISIAIAQILGYIKLFQLPQGGSITFAMLPIFIYCARWGFTSGLITSFSFGILQLVLDGAYAWSWQSMLGDYLLAYSALGIAGLFYKKKGGFFVGAIVAAAARFLVHYVVGATVWAQYMPDTFFGMTMTTPWIYSALYNGSYIFLNLAIVLIIAAVAYPKLGKYFNPMK